MTRRTLAAAAGVAALALPAANVVAATRPNPKVVVTTRSFKGDPGSASSWGQVRVVIVVRKTTTTVGAKTTATKHITGMSVPVYPYQAARSMYITEESIPVLEHEALKAQSAHIDAVSGASYTSQAFVESLQSAILQEQAW